MLRPVRHLRSTPRRPAALLAGLLLLALPAAALGAEPVRLVTSDGVEIRGEFHRAVDGPGGAAVVAVHMFLGDRSQFDGVAKRFTDRGIGFLAIDLRGHGESNLRPADREAVLSRDPAVFAAMRHDVAAAVEWLRQEGYDTSRVGLMGGSMGAVVALDYAADAGRVAGLVLLTPLASHAGLDPLASAAKLGDRPVLVVSARAEAGKGATRIFECLTGHHVDLRLPEAERAHGTALLDRVDGLADDVAGWLRDRLGARIVLDGEIADDERDKAEVRPLGENAELLVRRLPDHIWLAATGKGLDTLEVTIGDRVWVFTPDGLARKDGTAAGLLPLPAGTTRGTSDDAIEVLLPLGAFGLRRGYEIRLSVRGVAGLAFTPAAEGIRFYYPETVRRRD